jgi:hypothetical protein
MTVLGPGQPIPKGAVRIKPKPGEDIAAAFTRTLIENIGGYQNLPVGLRPGDVVGPRPKVVK